MASSEVLTGCHTHPEDTLRYPYASQDVPAGPGML